MVAGINPSVIAGNDADDVEALRGVCLCRGDSGRENSAAQNHHSRNPRRDDTLFHLSNSTGRFTGGFRLPSKSITRGMVGAGGHREGVARRSSAKPANRRVFPTLPGPPEPAETVSEAAARVKNVLAVGDALRVCGMSFQGMSRSIDPMGRSDGAKDKAGYGHRAAPRTHRIDESAAGYSLAGCAPAEPASASPAVDE